MSIKIEASSSIVNATTGSEWKEHVRAWHGHFTGSNNHWSVKNYTDDAGSSGTGDIGFTITPSTSSLNFDLNVRFQSSSGEVFANIDPSGAISNPLDPTGSGSPQTSQEPTSVFNSPEPLSYASGSLISTTYESLTIATRNTAKDATPEVFHGGDIYTPMIANFPDNDIDGLGYFSGNDMQFGTSNGQLLWKSNPGSPTHQGQFRVGNTSWVQSWTLPQSTNYRDSGNSTIGFNTPLPVPIGEVDSVGDFNNYVSKYFGTLKYCYVWDSSKNALDRLETNSKEGYIFVYQDNTTNAHILFPWEKGVLPDQ